MDSNTIILKKFSTIQNEFNYSTTSISFIEDYNNIFSSENENNSSLQNFPENCTSEKGYEYDRIYPALKLYEGIIDKKYIDRISPFWLKFEPYSSQTHYLIAAIYFIITVIGCCGNALVIYMFIRCKSLRTPANTLVVNLAISDFFMVAKSPITIYNSIKLGPALGDLGCRIYGFVGGLTGTASIMTLTAISIDRYNVVVYPLDPLRSTTKIRSILMLTIVWLYGFTFSIIPTLDIGLSNYVPEGLLTTCGFDYLSKSLKARIFMFTFFVAAWCVPFSTITYCYFYILKAVIAANSIQSSKDKNKTEFKLAGILIAIIGLWFLAWTPYALVALLGISGNENLLTPLLSMIPAIFCKTSACINPYVYAVKHPRFKMEFKRMFLFKKLSRRTSYGSSFTRLSRTKIVTNRKIALIEGYNDVTNDKIDNKEMTTMDTASVNENKNKKLNDSNECGEIEITKF